MAAQIPIGIAQIDHGDPAVARRGPRCAVPDGFPRRDRPLLQHARRGKNDLLDMSRRLGARGTAVQRDPRTGQVERIVGAQADAGAVGQTMAPRRNFLA